jgi:hypothetical protein
MTDRAVDVFDQPRKTCFGCEHWNLYYKTCPDGYYIAPCQVDEDNRDHKLKRASDYCSRWKRR